MPYTCMFLAITVWYQLCSFPPFRRRIVKLGKDQNHKKILGAWRMDKYLSDSFTYILTCKPRKIRYFVQMRSLPNILFWSTEVFYKGFIVICPWKLRVWGAAEGMQYYLITPELYISVSIYHVCHLHSLVTSLKQKQPRFLFQILMFTCYGT